MREEIADQSFDLFELEEKSIVSVQGGDGLEISPWNEGGKLLLFAKGKEDVRVDADDHGFGLYLLQGFFEAAATS